MSESVKISSVALKIASRCNLNCSYCYIYNMGDDTYKMQPKFMSHDTLQKAFLRIKEHCDQHAITHFTIYIFGGEPLLAGKTYFKELIEMGRATLDGIELLFATQTNGTFIDAEWIQLFEEYQIVFGVSLDGYKEINDKYRVDHQNRGSYDKVKERLDLMLNLGYRPGINSVVNLDADPIKTYHHFKDLRVGDLDFLVPDGNFHQPPPKLDHKENQFNWDNTPYADWLIDIFDLWFDDDQPKPQITMFKTIVNLTLGITDNYDYLGVGRNELLIIETDGGIEPADDFKICGNGFTQRGLSVNRDSFDRALEDELIQEYNLSSEKLCSQCNKCPVKDICGGWYVPTRYGEKNGFNNPSIYCPDAMKLITHIRNKVVEKILAVDPQIESISTISLEQVRTEVTMNS